jgi:ketosteroid isomerase-like protein
MRRTDAFFLMLTLSACMTACSKSEFAASASHVSTPRETAVVPEPSPTSAMESAPAVAAEAADPTPADAKQVVVDYYAAIDAGDHAKAYALWSDGGAASGQNFEHFSGGYANTRSVRAVVGEPTDEEGAAGSRYIQVPVQLVAVQHDGGERHYRGRFTLRALVADGASPEQRRWHLASAEMQRITQ